MFYDWRECMMSTWLHETFLVQLVVLTLGNKVVLSLLKTQVRSQLPFIDVERPNVFGPAK